MAENTMARLSICNIAEGVLAYMSPDEVARMVAELRDEAGRLEAWNKRRGSWVEPAPRWRTDASLPRSQDDYGKVLTRY